MENNIPVTEAELAEWQALCDAANPEPWEGSFLAGTNATWADHRFANGSRTIMPRLIAEVLRMRGVVDAERSDHEDTRKYWQKICMRAARDADREINQLASAMSADSDRIKKAETENARLQSLIAAYKELDAGNKDYIEGIDWLANDVPAPIHAANRRLEAARARVAGLEGGAS